MHSFVRAALSAALIVLVLMPAAAADKAFQRDDLDQAAIKLEAQIKQDAGTVTKSLGEPAPASRRRLSEARLPHRHAGARAKWSLPRPTTRRTGCGWRAPCARSARATPARRALLLDRASTAAYIAYQRASDRGVEADSLALLGQTLADRQLWRPALDAMRLSLDFA